VQVANQGTGGAANLPDATQLAVARSQGAVSSCIPLSNAPYSCHRKSLERRRHYPHGAQENVALL
jgi:hypothetical protein